MSDPRKNPPVRYRIKDLVLDTGSRRVTRGDKRLSMGGLTFDLLLALAQVSPAMLGHDELAERVWKGRPVSPETLGQRVKMLRDALSDDASAPRYVEAIRGQGYRLLVPAEILTGSTGPRARYGRAGLALATAGAVALLLGGAWWLRNVAPAPSVAVLPFADMSPSGDQQYLADGFAEELINQLSRLDGLDVASRTESFYYPQSTTDLDTIGEKLSVTAILEGSVRRSADEIRVTVQLIDIDSGFHLWSDHFDRRLEDTFAIQEDIARSVAGALGITLGVGAVNEFPGAGTRSFPAYEAYLQGDYEKAMELDGEYAAAWGARGIEIASTMWESPPDAAPAIIQRSYEHVARSVELDPGSAQAHANFATLIYATMDWVQAEQSFARALTLRRNAYTLGHYANMMMRAGRSRRAHALHEERDALLRVPEGSSVLRANVEIALGNLDAARLGLESVPDQYRGYLHLAIAYNQASIDEISTLISTLPHDSIPYRELYGPLSAVLHDREAALAFLRGLADDPDRHWPNKYRDIALAAAYLGDAPLAFEVFRRELTYTTIRFGSLWFPVMSDVRKLSAFKTFVRDVNLDDYWRKHGWSDFCRPRGKDDFVCE